jgi:membrane fusion protein, multidrug efflux system
MFRLMLSTRTFCFALIPAMLLLAACDRRSSSTPPRGPASSQFVVDVVAVAPEPFRETLFATGTLQAREAVILQAERPGLVREIRIEEGQPVRAGEVLVVLDDTELQAQLARAEAQLQLAGAMEARQRQLFENAELISEAEYEQNLASLHIAQAETELIKAQLAKMRIAAPFDGVPGLRRISVGTYLTPAVPICTFQDVLHLKVDFSLPERYRTHLHPGQQVSFAVAGQSGRFTAQITAIEPSVDVATRSVLVRAEVPNPDQRLAPGSFAEVEVALREIPDAILVPPIALVPGLQRSTVFVYQEGRARERVVQSGLRTADSVQILEGLGPGDQLIVSGIMQLRSGMPVQVRGRTPAAQAGQEESPPGTRLPTSPPEEPRG